MPESISFGLGCVALVVIVLLIGRSRASAERRREADILASPVPDTWVGIIRSNVGLYGRMPDRFRSRFEGLVNLFIDRVTFEGCDGQVVDDEVRVTIAAQASLLLLNRPENFFRGLHTVLVYPQAYVAHPETMDEDGLVLSGPEERAGESWDSGTVVLAWDHVSHGARDVRDGNNLVLHEFAHQLDQVNGDADGAPELRSPSCYRTWSQVLGEEYRKLRESVEEGRPTVIDGYGATEPGEFFAVVTEAFYEKPRQLRQRHPDLYAQFSGFYGLDPAEWAL